MIRTLFICVALAACLSPATGAERPTPACGADWIQNAWARVEISNGLSYACWDNEQARWECVFTVFPGGANWGAPAGTLVDERTQAVSTRIDGQTACLDYAIEVELPARGRTTVTITVRLLPDSPLMQVSCLDPERKPVAVGCGLHLAHPGRFGVYDESLGTDRFALGQADAAVTLQPTWVFWPGRRFLAMFNSCHPYVCAVFTPGGTPGSLAGGLYSGGRRFSSFSHLNEPFVVAGGMLAHDVRADAVFHWATGWWQRLRKNDARGVAR